jgi:hypothetical protein
MSLLTRLFKPAWQQPEASRRAAAVESATDPALLAALPALATQDPSSRVRRAALQRLADLGLWGDRSRHDNDAELRSDARRAYINGLIGADANQLAEAERLLRVEDASDVLEAVAARARAAPLRRIALEQLNRAGLLADCALTDPDIEIRLWLVGRIDAQSTLKRLVEQARTRDKRVHKAAKDRLEALRLASGDRAAAEQRAQEICNRLDQLIHSLPADGLVQLTSLEAAWNTLPLAAEEDWLRRFSGLLSTARSALQARQQQLDAAAAARAAADAAPTPPASEAAAPLSASTDDAERTEHNEPAALSVDASASSETVIEQAPAAPSDPRVSDLRQRLRAASARADEAELVDLSALTTELAELAAELVLTEAETAPLQQDLARLRRAIETQQRLQQESAAHAELARLRAAIADQQALPAKQSLDQLDELRKSLKGLPKAIRADYAELRADALKLIDWQRWSNNEIRRRLCDELAALPAAGLHPDAVATRVRELQTEWRRVDALEGIDPKAPARGLGRRFNALVHATLKPARPFFEKRAELRREKTDALTEATTGLEEQLSQVADDRTALLALRRSLSDSFRKLDDVDPRQRRVLGQRLRADLAAVDASLASQAERVELAKRKLIAELRRDLGAIAPEKRADRAKQAQQAWKLLGSGDRKRDQLQWVELRELVDPIFLDVHSARAEEQAADRAQREEIEALLAAIEQAIAATEPSANALEQQYEVTRMRLAALAPLDRATERRADELLDRLLARKQESERQSRLGAYSALATRAARLDRIEQCWLKGEGLDREALQELVEQPPLSQPALQRALEVRRDRLLELAGEGDEAPMAEVLQALEAQHRAAEQLLLECEFHCGVDSPEAQRKERMDLQVRRLADRMSGGDAGSPADEAARLWAEWFGIGPLEGAARAVLAERFAACRKGLEASLA